MVEQAYILCEICHVHLSISTTTEKGRKWRSGAFLGRMAKTRTVSLKSKSQAGYTHSYAPPKKTKMSAISSY